MATIGVKAKKDEVLIWITGTRGGRQEFKADIARVYSFKAMLESAIQKAEDSGREGCDLFERPINGKMYPSGDCQGDGHYLCRECIYYYHEDEVII